MSMEFATGQTWDSEFRTRYLVERKGLESRTIRNSIEVHHGCGSVNVKMSATSCHMCVLTLSLLDSFQRFSRQSQTARSLNSATVFQLDEMQRNQGYKVNRGRKSVRAFNNEYQIACDPRSNPADFTLYVPLFASKLQ